MLNVTGDKNKSKKTESQSFNQNQTTSLSPRAYGLLSNRLDDLDGREYAALDPNAYKAYEDPYQQEVIDATTADINASRDLAMNDQRKAMLARGALGSSDRRGVAEAETRGAFDRTLATTLAGLRSRGYSQAQGIAQGENSNKNTFQAQTDAMINQLMAILANETTTNSSGTSQGTATARGSSFGFGFEPFKKKG